MYFSSIQMQATTTKTKNIKKIYKKYILYLTIHIKWLQMYLHTHTHTSACIFIYNYFSICVCVSLVNSSIQFIRITVLATSKWRTNVWRARRNTHYSPPTHTHTDVEVVQKQISEPTVTRTMKKIVTLNLIHHCCE